MIKQELELQSKNKRKKKKRREIEKQSENEDNENSEESASNALNRSKRISTREERSRFLKTSRRALLKVTSNVQRDLSSTSRENSKDDRKRTRSIYLDNFELDKTIKDASRDLDRFIVDRDRDKSLRSSSLRRQ